MLPEGHGRCWEGDRRRGAGSRPRAGARENLCFKLRSAINWLDGLKPLSLALSPPPEVRGWAEPSSESVPGPQRPRPPPAEALPVGSRPSRAPFPHHSAEVFFLMTVHVTSGCCFSLSP